MKILTIYATRYGACEEVALKIQKRLGKDCISVNIMADKVPSLDGFDTVILGGSIYMGRIQKQLTTYIRANLERLLTKKVGLFICAGAQTEEERKKELQSNFPDELYHHAFFKDSLGYAFSFKEMHFFDKLIMKKIKGDANSVSEFPQDRIENFIKKIENQ